MFNRRLLTGFVAAVAMALPALASATTTPTNVPNELYSYAKTGESRQLVERVDDALNGISYTYYLWGGDSWNDSTGTYKVDCTGFVNRMVEDANPSAYDEILEYRDTTRASANDYYYMFRRISYGTTKDKWYRVEKASYLRPGDILVWKYDAVQASGSTGHAMVVVDVPKKDSRWSNVYKVRIADSAKSGHSTDNRGSSGSGVGAGYILLKVSTSSGRPYAYAWNTNGVWHDDVTIAMARPNY
jgi:hypothetical protein